MNEAFFRFKATGEVDINSLSIDYGNVTPSEEWCHSPYVLKVDGSQKDLYELRFPLSPFNVPENGKLTRECIVTGPIYVTPKLAVPVVNVNLTIKQIACLDKFSCDDLLNLIEVSVNADDNEVGPDGGIVEIERSNYDPYFKEELVSVTDEHGNQCSWAGFDEDGNIVVSRRYFGEDGDEERKALATYRYIYAFDSDIDNESCSGEFVGEISQLARTCEEKDVYAVEGYTNFPRTGETRKLTDIVTLAGLDAEAFEVSNVSVSGTAFYGVRSSIVVRHSELCGYTITTASNSAENLNSGDNESIIKDKSGEILVTYNNKYLDDCVFEYLVKIRVNGLSCEELLEHVSIAIKLEGSEEYVTEGNINISSHETHFTIDILGDEYAECFDINEDECVIPASISVVDDEFIIPTNEDPFLVRTHEIKIVCGIIDEQYSECSAYGCSFEQTFMFTQDVFHDIEEIGSRSVINNSGCDTIGEIPSKTIEYEQPCDYIEQLTDNSSFGRQDCET